MTLNPSSTEYIRYLTQWESVFLNERMRPLKKTYQESFPSQVRLNIPFHLLLHANRNLAIETLNHPKISLNVASEVLFNIIPHDLKKNIDNGTSPIVSLHSLDETRYMNLKDIRSKHIGELWTFTGRIRKSQKVKVKVKIATWECLRCGGTFITSNHGLELEHPLSCNEKEGGCGSTARNTRFTLVEDQCIYRNFQLIYMEELAGYSEGQPQNKMVFLWDDLTGVFPCNQATITGYISLIQLKKHRTAIMDTYIEAIHIDVEDIREPIKITSEDEVKILNIARGPNPIERLKKSVAPSVYGHDDIKTAIILQQVGGVSKILPDQTKKRGNIHVLIVGDPGTAKSSLLKLVPTISPIGFYGSGEGTSGPGLTFAMVPDEFDKTWAVEMGLYPMCDGGVCAFDELDKCPKDDIKRLHGAMETGELEVAKAGIITTLAADASFLAGANPIHGRFDPHKYIHEQIDLTPPLISRFDLIFSVIDLPNEKLDNKIAEHILAGHQGNLEVISPEFDTEFMRKYFHYIKSLKPIITSDIALILIEKYKTLRTSIANLTPRQLEAIIRMSEASAKIRASKKVENQDIDLAFKLFKNFIESISTDHTTGTVDLDIISTGLSSSQRDRIWTILEIIKDVQGTDGVVLEDIMRIGEERGLPRARISEDLERLKREGRIYEKYEDRYRLA